MLSREQYLHDVEQGLHDARLAGTMGRRDIAEWTQAIGEERGTAEAG